MNANTQMWIYVIWLITGTISFVLLIALLVFFGKIIKLQMKIWFLAKRGYHLVEHIGINKVRSYFFLKPVDNKFDFNSGFYIHEKNKVSKSSSFMQEAPVSFKFKGMNEPSPEQQDAEFEKLKETAKSFVYKMEAVTLKWGIPVITYYGNNPQPVDFEGKETEHSAQLIRDVYIRLLTTIHYGTLKKLVMWAIIAGFAVTVVLLLMYLAISKQGQTIGMCVSNWNLTQSQLISCVNESARIAAQGSNFIVTGASPVAVV